MFERSARWMLLGFALMVAVGYVLSMVVPSLLGPRGAQIGREDPPNAERCDAEGGLWDAAHGTCRHETYPRALHYGPE